jgi:hypothetical protein
VQRFLEHGMHRLFAKPPRPPTLRVPAEIRAAITALKVEHPPLHVRDSATIGAVRVGRNRSHTTVKPVLAETPPRRRVRDAIHHFMS